MEPEKSQPKAEGTPSLGGDILYGADDIAIYLFGDAKHRRRIYWQAENKVLPIFKIGASLCARKTVLLDWIAEQEKRRLDSHPVP